MIKRLMTFLAAVTVLLSLWNQLPDDWCEQITQLLSREGVELVRTALHQLVDEISDAVSRS